MRPWILSSLVAILAAAAPAAAIEPKYLPPDAEAVITLNLKALFDSDLAKAKKDVVDMIKSKIKDKLDDLPLKEHFDKVGFEPLRDLHSITFTSNGGKDVSTFFIAVEGQFDTDKIVDFARERPGVTISKIGSTQVVEFTPEGQQQTVYAGIVNNRTMLLAPSRDVLKGAIGRGASNKAAIKPALKTLLADTSSKQTFSLVLTGDGLANAISDAPVPPQGKFGEQIQGVDGIAAGLTVSKDIAFQISASSKDDEAAKKLSGALNLGLLFIKGQIGQKAQGGDEKAQLVQDVANTLRVTQQGLTVSLRGEVSPQNVDRILSFLPKR
jgi:hypothetical protein